MAEAATLRKLCKTDVINAIPALLRNPIAYDCQLIARPGANEELESELRRPFKLLLVRPAADLVPKVRWSITSQLNTYGTGGAPAYQPAVASAGEQTTHDVEGDMMRKIFLEPHKVSPAFRLSNVLNCRNTARLSFFPTEILKVSLLHQIDFQSNNAAVSRSDADPTPIPEYDWVILTPAGMISVFHTDHAGYATVIVGIEGRKVWVMPNGPSERVHAQFSIKGPYNTEWDDGVSATSIGPGDML
jgi:hypothetical protein